MSRRISSGAEPREYPFRHRGSNSSQSVFRGAAKMLCAVTAPIERMIWPNPARIYFLRPPSEERVKKLPITLSASHIHYIGTYNVYSTARQKQARFSIEKNAPVTVSEKLRTAYRPSKIRAEIYFYQPYSSKYSAALNRRPSVPTSRLELFSRRSSGRRKKLRADKNRRALRHEERACFDYYCALFCSISAVSVHSS